MQYSECSFFQQRDGLYLIILSFMKSMDSAGSLALDSIMSPPKNNKSTTQLDTMASLEFSDYTQNQTILKLNSIPKQYNHDLLTSQLSKIDQSVFQQDNFNDAQAVPIQNSQIMDRLAELQLLQKWMSQACNNYYDSKTKLVDNQENIKKLEHKNRLKKDQVKHIKKMVEYLEEKAQKMEKFIINKIRRYEEAVKSEIRQSQQRAENMYYEIKKLEQQIEEQRALEKQIFTSQRSKQSKQSKQQSNEQKFKRVSSRLSFSPQNQHQVFQNVHQNHHPHRYPHHPAQHAYHYPYPYSAPNYQYHYYPHYNPYQQHPNHHYYAHSHATQNQQIPYTNSGPILKKSPSFQHSPTPQFLSKKNSVLQQNSFNPNQINNNLILQAMTNNLQNLINPQFSPILASSHKKVNSGDSQGLPSDLVLEMESPSYKKNNNNNQFPLTLNHLQQYDENDPLYSPTNQITTPQFDLKLNKIKSFEQALKSQQKSFQTAEKTQRNNLGSSTKKSMMEESKIRIDVEDTNSEMSKFSIQKRRKIDPNIRQSTIKIEMIEDQSRSGDNSLLSDPNNTPRLRSPTVDIQANQNSSLEKMLEEQSSSQIFSKPLPAPPRLPNQTKKLRKVTQQQSDLFDSNGDPRLLKKIAEPSKKQQENNYTTIDLVIDKSNIGVSQKYDPSIQSPRDPFQFSTSPKQEHKTQEEMNMQPKSKIGKKQPTDEDQDDDDFMNVNLLAISKISKQKQFSQGFKTISDDGNQIPESKRIKSSNKNSAIHRSQNLVQNNNLRPPMENIEEQDQFGDLNSVKREMQLKRVRKSSGSRFSLLEERRPESPTKV